MLVLYSIQTHRLLTLPFSVESGSVLQTECWEWPLKNEYHCMRFLLQKR